MAAYAPQADEPELIARHAMAVDPVQRRLLYANRILVAGGWLVLTYTINNRSANAEHALVGLALLLLGVFLITISPVASQFLGAAAAGAAVADTVLFYFFALPN